MKNFWPLILIQLKDKLDLSWTKKKKSLIQKIVFSVLKFILVGGAVFGLLYLLSYLMFIYKSEIVNTYILFFSLMTVLNIFSVSFGLMKSLYYADDNKVLVTLPVSSSKLFFSKIIVYLFFQIKRDLDIFVPVTLGFIVYGTFSGVINIASCFWCWIPFIFYTISIVLVGAILSIPFLYIYQFLKTYPIVELVLLGIAIIGGLALAIWLISLIPQNIDINNQWPAMKQAMQNAINQFKLYVYPITFVVRTMVGELNDNLVNAIAPLTFVNIAIIIGVVSVLGVIVYFAIKPFYFNMMTKTFEFNKGAVDNPKKNSIHKKYITFANKELKLSFRDFDVSGSYLAVYILVPLLLFLMDRIFGAIATGLKGDIMTYAFNILLIALPYLASNSIIATIYSKEGRAAYIKKTKPIDPLFPLISKVIFNLILSVPSIIASMVVFAMFSNVNIVLCILLGLSILLIQYGHIFYSAGLDIMNPQNEVYATNGEQISNPNENKATIVGFVIAGAYALAAYFLMTESQHAYGNYVLAFIKLLLIAMVLFASMAVLFVLKVKAFYYEK